MWSRQTRKRLSGRAIHGHRTLAAPLSTGRIEPFTTHQSMQHLGEGRVFLGMNLWPCLPDGLLGSEGRVSECILSCIKVAGSSPAEVLLPTKVLVFLD